VPALWCVCVCVLTPVMRAAVCLLYVSAVSIVVLLFCVCVTRGIHPLFAVVLLLLLLLLLLSLLLCAERLFARAWYRCVSRYDVRERRSVTALSSGVTASGTCGAVWLYRFWGPSHTVLCVSDSMQGADWLFI
jgi:hypothetical protein